MDERLLTTAEVGERLHRHIKSVQRLIRRGYLPAHRIGPNGNYLVKESDLEAFLQPVRPDSLEATSN